VPTTGHTESNVWYRIHLEVRDSSGQVGSTFVDVLPRKSMITLTTSPSGLQLTLDAQPVASPTTVEGVVGIERSIGAAPTQTVGGVTYAFVSWSDGGSATHTISTPPTSTTYTATYRSTGGTGCTSAPGAPVNLTASVSGSTVTLRWTAPSGGSAPTSYRVEGGMAPGQTQMTINTSSTTFTNTLPPSGDVYARVRSVNACGTSGPSNEVMVDR
jgi:hypothetical protein